MFYYASMYENIGVKPGAFAGLNRTMYESSAKKPILSKISPFFDERSFFQPNTSDDDTASENETLEQKEKR